MAVGEVESGEACIHACTWGCGRKYDVVFTQVIDASTLMLCMPCFMSFATNVMRAMVDGTSPEVLDVVAGANLSDVMVVTESYEPGIKPGTYDTPTADDEFVFDGT